MRLHRLRRRRMRRTRRSSRLGGLVFLLAIGAFLLWGGGWFALSGLGVPVPGIERIWQVFPMFGGFLFGLGFLVNPRAYGLVFPGTAALLVGAFFLLFSLEVVDWDRMDALWPVFPMIGGAAFVALWIAGLGRDVGLLVPAFLGFAVGVIGLSFTVTPLGSLFGLVGWPLALLAAGSVLVLLSLTLFAFRSLRFVVGRLAS